MNYRDDIIKYLRRLRWDGTSRIYKWLSTYSSAESIPYNNQAGEQWLLGAVRRICEPGSAMPFMLVLESMQEVPDPSLAQALVPNDYWAMTCRAINNKSIKMAANRWIVEMPELRALDIDDAHSLIVRDWDGYLDLGQGWVSEARQFALLGWTRAPLHDRHLGEQIKNVEIHWINTHEIDYVREQLWAEAYYRYDCESGHEVKR